MLVVLWFEVCDRLFCESFPLQLSFFLFCVLIFSVAMNVMNHQFALARGICFLFFPAACVH